MRMNNFRVKRHMLGVGPRPNYRFTRFIPYEVAFHDAYNGESFHRIVRAWERAVPWYVKRTGDATMEIQDMPEKGGWLLIIEIPSREQKNV